MTIFAELGLNSTLRANIKRLGYKEPTDIQEKAIGSVLSGADTYAIAPTGTGKTAAYLLPLLQELSRTDNSEEQVRPVRALLLVPTRDLAQQLEESIANYGKDLKLRTIGVYGGVRIESHVKRFKRGADIIVATPKRLIDLLKLKTFNLDNVRHFLMDEADRLISMGVQQELQTIFTTLPAKRQVILFSATDTKPLQKFGQAHLSHAKHISATEKQPALNKIVHSMYRCPRDEKTENLFNLLNMLDCDRALIFARTKYDVDKLTAQLNEAGFASEGLHNDVPQKRRLAHLNAFKQGDFKFLVATDIASRGIDISELYYVINVDLPVNANDYVHRVGRTARMNSDTRQVSKKKAADKMSRQSLSKDVADNKRLSFVDPNEASKFDIKTADIMGHAFSLVCPEQERLVDSIAKAVGKDIIIEIMPWQ